MYKSVQVRCIFNNMNDLYKLKNKLLLYILAYNKGTDLNSDERFGLSTFKWIGIDLFENVCTRVGKKEFQIYTTCTHLVQCLQEKIIFICFNPPRISWASTTHSSDINKFILCLGINTAIFYSLFHRGRNMFSWIQYFIIAGQVFRGICS